MNVLHCTPMTIIRCRVFTCRKAQRSQRFPFNGSSIIISSIAVGKKLHVYNDAAGGVSEVICAVVGFVDITVCVRDNTEQSQADISHGRGDLRKQVTIISLTFVFHILKNNTRPLSSAAEQYRK